VKTPILEEPEVLSAVIPHFAAMKKPGGWLLAYSHYRSVHFVVTKANISSGGPIQIADP